MTPTNQSGITANLRKLSLAARGFSARLLVPVDIASLVYFRIAFGAIMLWEVWRYFSHGWIEGYYIDPGFHFTYYGFDWIRPWPGDGMYLHFYALGALAIFIMVGLWYRISAILFFLGFTYVFLLDQTRYLNHFYLISLISFLMVFIPANRAFSVDSLRRPHLRANTAPAWALWLLRAQIGIVYFYGGLAKLNGDWLHGDPMRAWLANRTDFPLIGPLFTQEWMVSLFSYGGLLLDLLVVPLLLWQRTRVFALAAAVVFHLLNAKLFTIGIFPWFMIAATLLFLPPQWPRYLTGLWRRFERSEQPVEVFTRSPWPGLRVKAAKGLLPLRAGEKGTLGLLGTYLALQLLVPLRHHIYSGNVSWTEEGHRFSWHMMLRSKSAKAQFFATDRLSNGTWAVDPLDYLTRRQLEEMSTRPDMILQFSHHIADDLRQQGYQQIEVRAKVTASLNGRKPQLLIDPTVDLAGQPATLLPVAWIMPLVEPRRTGGKPERATEILEEP